MASKIETPKEQVLYANILFYGCWLGIFIMLITYGLYVLGVLDPYVSLEEITRLWSQPVARYAEEARIPLGWSWVALLGKGDFLNFIGIVTLAVLTVLCFITLIPAYFRDRQWAF